MSEITLVWIFEMVFLACIGPEQEPTGFINILHQGLVGTIYRLLHAVQVNIKYIVKYLNLVPIPLLGSVSQLSNRYI